MSQRVRILLEVAMAISFLHEWSPPVCHRDIKPGNVLLGPAPMLSVKLGDVGLAKFMKSHQVGRATAF